MPKDANDSGESGPSLFVVVLGLAFLGLNAYSFLKAYQLKHSGALIQGTVSRIYVTRRKGGFVYNVDYAFTASGLRYADTGDISRDSYLKLRPGDPIAIRYVPFTPSISETGEMSHYNTTLVLTEMLGFPASFFILFLAFRKQGSQEQVRHTPQSPEKTPTLELPNTIKAIAFTVYPVSDIPRARKFYENALGLRAAREIRGEWVEYQLWDNRFAITTLLGNGVKIGAESGASIAFEVYEVDGFVDRLRKDGIRVKVEPFSTPVGRMAMVLDPDGNALALHHRSNGI